MATPNDLPTPPSSVMSPATTTASTITSPAPTTSTPTALKNPLPKPRRTPLKRGAAKETELLSYLNNHLNAIQRRLDDRLVAGAGGKKSRRHSPPAQPHHNTNSAASASPETGYASFAQAAADIEHIVDILWVTNTPTIQTPYLLNLASLVSDALPLFAPKPSETFALLEKLDVVFASLIAGRDVLSGATLEADEDNASVGKRARVSVTEKVRIKGVVERARVVVVNAVMRDDGFDDGEGEVAESEGEGSGGGGFLAQAARAQKEKAGGKEKDEFVSFEGFDNNDDDEYGDVDMEGSGEEGEREDREEEDVGRLAARVFERTLAELGDVLGGEPIGIITDE